MWPGWNEEIAETLNISWTGVDGDFTLKDKTNIIIHDFSVAKLKLDKHFDLAWSSEFLEHVDEKYTDNYMTLFQILILLLLQRPCRELPVITT